MVGERDLVSSEERTQGREIHSPRGSGVIGLLPSSEHVKPLRVDSLL
jgi:hypothetical protein